MGHAPVLRQLTPLEGVQTPGPVHLVRLPAAAGVQPAVVDQPQSQPQEEAGAGRRQQPLQQATAGQPGALSHPGDHQQKAIIQEERQVDGSTASGSALSHVEPGEIKDGGHRRPVQPLGAGIWHKVRALKPHPEQQHQPQAQEVQGHTAGEEGREQGHDQDSGPQQQQVPQEVDHGGTQPQEGLGGEAGAQGPVVVKQCPRDTHKGRADADPYEEEEETGEPCGQPAGTPQRPRVLRRPRSYADVGITDPNLLQTTAGDQQVHTTPNRARIHMESALHRRPFLFRCYHGYIFHG